MPGFSSVSGTARTNEPFRFQTTEDLGSVQIDIEGDIFSYDTLSLDGGATTQPYSIVLQGTVSDMRNNNFFPNFSEVSVDDPSDYWMLSSGGETYYRPPDFPAI